MISQEDTQTLEEEKHVYALCKSLVIITGVIKFIDLRYFEYNLFLGLKDISFILLKLGNLAINKEVLILCNYLVNINV